MQTPLKVKFSPDWDFEIFLFKNYGSSHTKNDRYKALDQYFYYREYWEKNKNER